MKVQLADRFWSPRFHLNRKEALVYQWERYKVCGTLGNFRLAAEKKHSRRQGFFYTDSDLHKWADAVSRTLASEPDAALEGYLNEYIGLMGEAQEEDGYLYTWNQVYFPNTRWKNLLIEHELYTAGHFIEAGISHFQATGEKRLFDMAVKTADLIVRDFGRINSSQCPGHQEIELALMKLYRTTEDPKYRTAAEQFLRRRGEGRFFGYGLIREALSHRSRSRKAAKADGNEGSKELGFDLGENIRPSEPRFLALRSFFCFITGAYHQQHKALLKQTVPQGHSVRWAYMMQAAAMLARETNDVRIGGFLSDAWENLTRKKMYITGGIGSLPVIEGFGRNYELNNEYAYGETCAAIGSIYWNDEMLKLSPRARYADLMERQLYNAAAVGISQDGKKYFYRNPLESRGELERRSWFRTACCPSNISRLWADVHKFIFHETAEAVYIDQYIGAIARFDDRDIRIELTSKFPWEGRARAEVFCSDDLKIRMRIPGWARSWTIRVDGEVRLRSGAEDLPDRLYTDIINGARYEDVVLAGGADHVLEMDFPMDIIVNRSDTRVRDNRGKIAISRGPLVYCVESDDEFRRNVDISNLNFEYDDTTFMERSGFISDGSTSFIPYYLWGNRGKKHMKVWTGGIGR